MDTIDAELDTWEQLWLSGKVESLPKNVEEIVKYGYKSIFPNIFQILKLIAVTPVTTCTCERSISSLRRLKTYLRSTMDQVNVLSFQFSFIS